MKFKKKVEIMVHDLPVGETSHYGNDYLQMAAMSFSFFFRLSSETPVN
jgi:hypothetical protein